ncbi:MAG: alpha-L-rhamnosidase-related protein, partial [Asticcacaulis sp.]
PPMLYKKADSGTGIGTPFPQSPQVIAPHSHAVLLIRRDQMISAYPALSVSGGRDALIRMGYAEALYDDKGRKGDRAETAGRHFRGLTDSFIADGKARTFAPLHWRVWRYLQLDVTTRDAPLTLRGLDVHETRYPFEARGAFDSDDPELNRIWQIGWATATLDAHETYMDSAYWEQLQYVGDTRLQMLISYAVTGDARLAANAIDAFGWSNTEGGLTEGAYPSRGHNPIAPFSLLWIGQMHDWWRQQPDTSVIVRNLPRLRQVLDWFAPYLQDDGLLSRNPTWNFVDWVGKPRDDFPSFNARGESCLTTLIYLGALQQAADLEHALGDRTRGDDDAAEAETVKGGILTQCWDGARGLFADDPSKTLFSQHANALAVLYGVVPPDQGREILKRIVAQGITPPQDIIPVSYYFSWYLARAYEQAGMADSYADLLAAWRDLLPLHFVTWPEAQLEPRSDTHAWSAHPTADLLGVVAGIEPTAAGYAALRIAPHLGGLKRLTATAMTPSGPVTVTYLVTADRLSATIRKPQALPGTFEWGGKTYPLNGALTRLTLSPSPDRTAAPDRPA